MASSLVTAAACLIAAAPAQGATPTVTEFDDGIAGQGTMYGITPASDGRIWFTSYGTAHDVLAAIDPQNPVAGAPVTVPTTQPWGAANAPDGNVFFSSRAGNSIGELVPTTGTNSITPLGNGNVIQPFGAATGPDGNIWVTGAAEQTSPAPPANDKIGIVAPGVPPTYTSEVTLPATADPYGIAVARSDASGSQTPSLWIPEFGGNRMVRVTPGVPSPNVTAYPLPNPNDQPYLIALGPDGNLWYTQYGGAVGNQVGRITPPGSFGGPLLDVDEFDLPAGSGPQGIAAGPDGNMWIAATSRNSIIRMNMDGEVTGEFTVPSGAPNSIVPGSDGNLWFTTFDRNKVGRITTALDPPAHRNTTPITVPNIGASGAANPYPSNVTVSGLQGNITDVTVRLTGISHTFPDDLDILLEGPQGQNVMLASDVGSPDLSTGYPADGITLNFSDSAPRLLSSTEPLVSGFWKPTDRAPADGLPDPAPDPPFGNSLNAFQGFDPNGTWKLYVLDDRETHTAPNPGRGRIFGGWGLDIETEVELTVNRAGSGTGTVTSAPAGISCGNTCNASFPTGSSVVLTANPAAGSTFSSWNACPAPSGNQCTVNMNTDRTVTATFSAVPAPPPPPPPEAPPPPLPEALDTSPPETTITDQPKDKLKTKKQTKRVSFGFVSSEPAAFQCQIDDEPFEACSSPFSFKVSRGTHDFGVRAVDSAGNPDPTPASDEFKVKRKR